MARTRDYDQSKSCQHCGTVFSRPRNLTSHKQWEQRRYCSATCGAAASRKGLAPCLYEHTRPDPRSGCILWTGAINNHGYGIVSPRYGVRLAHRAAWLVVNGPIPAGMVVMHKCDTPACVNPAHLRLGTMKDNSRDMVQKSRNVASPKLTDADVQAIRDSPDRGVDLARRYGVSKSNISGIRSGQRRPVSERSK